MPDSTIKRDRVVHETETDNEDVGSLVVLENWEHFGIQFERARARVRKKPWQKDSIFGKVLNKHQ